MQTGRDSIKMFTTSVTFPRYIIQEYVWTYILDCLMKTKSKISFASIMSDTMAVISKVNVIVLTLLWQWKFYMKWHYADLGRSHQNVPSFCDSSKIYCTGLFYISHTKVSKPEEEKIILGFHHFQVFSC